MCDRVLYQKLCPHTPLYKHMQMALHNKPLLHIKTKKYNLYNSWNNRCEKYKI